MNKGKNKIFEIKKYSVTESNCFSHREGVMYYLYTNRTEEYSYS